MPGRAASAAGTTTRCLVFAVGAATDLASTPDDSDFNRRRRAHPQPVRGENLGNMDPHDLPDMLLTRLKAGGTMVVDSFTSLSRIGRPRPSDRVRGVAWPTRERRPRDPAEAAERSPVESRSADAAPISTAAAVVPAETPNAANGTLTGPARFGALAQAPTACAPWFPTAAVSGATGRGQDRRLGAVADQPWTFNASLHIATA